MRDYFVYTTTTDARASEMLAELTREYDARYGTLFSAGGAAEEMQRYPPEAFAPPHGLFLLLLRQGQAIAGGAFKRYDAETAEFKRIWTHSQHRRQGLARLVLQELEAQCLRQGYRKVYLTTGCRQPEAVALYLGNGYSPQFDLNGDLESYRTLPFRKSLASQKNSHRQTGVALELSGIAI